MNALSRTLLVLYRGTLAPLLHGQAFMPAGCRFSPTCSGYLAEATRQYGLRNGFVLFLRRLARCRWGGSAGYDPVPPAS